ncbi:hypothetical protein GOR44_001950 [Salmonella enterica subsp. diarizonae]|nr:hypothetical protein [Salmonella enterica subsp. diarizonae]
MDGQYLAVINGQLCDRSIALMVIDKVLPTVLEVVAAKVKNDAHVDAERAAKTIVNAALGAINLRSLISPKC